MCFIFSTYILCVLYLVLTAVCSIFSTYCCLVLTSVCVIFSTRVVFYI